ncbi:MAG: uracil-DNA glycosylase family protein [Spirochaetota bacterium]
MDEASGLARQICAYCENYRLPDIEEFLRQNRPQIQFLYPLKRSAVLGPFREFYQRFYSSGPPRCLVFGINPGRLGAGVTGIQFTDTIRLEKNCGIPWPGSRSRESSSEFIYSMIEEYGRRVGRSDVSAFFQNFLLQSLLPLGLVSSGGNRARNFNFYDDKELLDICREKIVRHIQTLLLWGCRRDLAFCLGSGTNLKVLRQLNHEFQFFARIIALEHPRYVMQYKYKERQLYIAKYCDHFCAALP